MANNNNGFFRWVRVLHRWVSMTFVVFAAVLILQVVPSEPAFTVLSALAILQLVFLLLTGIIMAVRHFVLRARPRTSLSSRT